jgi:hypothetical protein
MSLLYQLCPQVIGELRAFKHIHRAEEDAADTLRAAGGFLR